MKKNKITEEHSNKIAGLMRSGNFTFQDIVNSFDGLFTDNQIRYHITNNYKHLKKHMKKEYSRGGSKLEYLLKELFPANLIETEVHVGNQLRVDIVVGHPYNLAFEYDGVQHHKRTNFFHNSRSDFEEAQERDRLKEHLCQGRGLNLIRVASLNLDKPKLIQKIDKVGYGSGTIASDKFLTKAEKRKKQEDTYKKKCKERLQSQSEERKQLARQRRREQAQKLKEARKSDPKYQSYKNSLKEKQKQMRKEQRERQKAWLKNNRN